MVQQKQQRQLYCSPYNQVKYGEKDGTCYSLKNLQTIAREYNRLSPDHQIPLNQNKNQLHADLEKAFKDVCNNELCWTQSLKSQELNYHLKNAFRPPKPLEWYNNKRTWLNTYDIVFVMEQYEKLYKDFRFLGVYPIDFADSNASGQCIGDILCTFNINNLLQKRKRRFGMVLNLDRHNEPGSHWVSLYCNLNPKRKNFGIYYYDSVANPATEEVTDFMNKVETQVHARYKENVAKSFVVECNKIQKQFKNSECGIFSIIFLTQCLKDVPFDYICEHMRTDDEINRLRNVIYSPSKHASQQQSFSF